MKTKESYHSLCRWTFHAGKGGFTPASMRPLWSSEKLDTAAVIELIRKKIAPRLPKHIVLGFEMHYDTEVNEMNVAAVTKALLDNRIYLAMITPGAHSHYAYGGIASLDEKERTSACAFGQKTVDMAYNSLQKTWHPQKDLAPTFVLWNGSYGYDLATVGIREMYRYLKESVAELCKYEQKQGGRLSIGIEPKPNEGHPAMLLPTVASALLFWKKLEQEFGISLERKGINKEFGHSEMIGLDHVYDTVEEIDHNAVVHMHINSQGYNDGIILGGPGKFDIDHGVRINGMNIAVAGLMKKAGYRRWKGHDMQVRAYDNEEQGLDRVVRSILSWEACEMAAETVDEKKLLSFLSKRQTAKAEDMMRDAVVQAQKYFDGMYD
jgi:xylose isomerase